MFNIKYNILVIIQVAVGLLNTALLIRVFGVSVQSDSYLLALSILAALQFILLVPIEQFMHFYNDQKVKSLKNAHSFYSTSLLFAFIIGLFLCLIFNYLINPIISVFTLNIDNERLMLLRNLLSISTFGLAFYSIQGLNERLLNAEMRFSIPYILNTIPSLCVVITQLLLIYFDNKNIILLAYAQAIATFFTATFGTIFIARKIIPFKFEFRHHIMKKFIKNSFAVKASAAIYSIGLPVIFNNFLVTFPQGYVSYFYYAKKIIDIIDNFVLGPSLNILNSKISQFLAKKESQNIIYHSQKFLYFSRIIFISAVIITFFAQLPILKFISNSKLSSMDLSNIGLLFLALVPYNYIQYIEAAPCSIITIASKNSLKITIVAIVFISSLLPSIYLLKPYFGIYALCVAMAIAQALCYFLFKYFSEQKLKEIS